MKTNRKLLSATDEILFWKYFEYFLPRCTYASQVCKMVWVKFQEEAKNYSFPQVMQKWMDQAAEAEPKPFVKRLQAELQNNRKLSSAGENWPLSVTKIFLDVCEESIADLIRRGADNFKNLALKMGVYGFCLTPADNEAHWMFLLSSAESDKFADLQAQIDRIYKKLHNVNDFGTTEELLQVNGGQAPSDAADQVSKCTKLSSYDEILYWKYFMHFMPRCTNAKEICDKIWNHFLSDGKDYTLWQIRQKWLEQISQSKRSPLIDELSKQIYNNAKVRCSKPDDWSLKETEKLLRAFEGIEDDIEHSTLAKVLYQQMYEYEFSYNIYDRNDGASDVIRTEAEIEAFWLNLLCTKSEKYQQFQPQIDLLHARLFKVDTMDTTFDIKEVLVSSAMAKAVEQPKIAAAPEKELREERASKKPSKADCELKSSEFMKDLLRFLQKKEEIYQQRHIQRMEIQKQQLNVLEKLVKKYQEAK